MSEISEYLAKIGSTGGSAGTAKQTAARREALKKARMARWGNRIKKKKVVVKEVAK